MRRSKQDVARAPAAMTRQIDPATKEAALFGAASELAVCQPL
jgi:hypothetical protein